MMMLECDTIRSMMIRCDDDGMRCDAMIRSMMMLDDDVGMRYDTIDDDDVGMRYDQ